MANENKNSITLKNKPINDLKNIALSMGLKDDESFNRTDYYNYIVYGTKPKIKSYTKKDLINLSIKDLREIANELDIASSYKYKKEPLIELIVEKYKNSDLDTDSDLTSKTTVELREIAKELNISKPYLYKKDQLIKVIEEKYEENLEYKDDIYSEDQDDKDKELYTPDENLEEDIEDNELEDEIDKIEESHAKKFGIELDEISNNATEAVGKMDDAKYVCGILELHQDGYGFLRVSNFLPSEGDIYVSPSQIRRFRLRNGDKILGIVRPSKDGESYNGLIYINEVNDKKPNLATNRPYFENLTPIYPREKIKMEFDPKDIATRVIDLICPVGKGQRGLIVSPPKSGKTTLLKKIAKSIEKNYPEIELFVLLIDERPEEVTDMQRSVKGQVVYSTFDETPKNHTRVAEMVLDTWSLIFTQAKKIRDQDHLIMFFLTMELSGGLDPLSLHKPKRFFGAARNIEEGGSLTILATALVETGSRMDDIIFEEFKGTGNMELHLDRKLSEKRIFPAIDIYKSGTRKEELLLNQDELNFAFNIRNAMSYNSSNEVTEVLLDEMTKTINNKTFVRDSKIIKNLS